MIYVAGPMFSQAELAFNRRLADTLEAAGARVFLPQRDGCSLAKLLEEMTPQEASRKIFALDTEMVQRAAAFLIILDGRVPDEGACVALGFAGAKGVPCYGLATDPRTAKDGAFNPMIAGSIQRVFRTVEEAVDFFRRFQGAQT